MIHQTIPVALIDRNPDQPRKRFDPDRLQELAESIKSMGLLQPIIVRARPDGRWLIVAGERRWRACQLAGLEVAPCAVVDLSDVDAYVQSVAENVNRADMTPMEEANGYATLLGYGMDVDQVAARFGKRPASVRWRLDLLRCSDAVQDALDNGVVGPDLAWQMSRVSAAGQQVTLRRVTAGDFRDQADAIAFVKAIEAQEAQPVMFGDQDTAEDTERKRNSRRATLSAIAAAEKAMTAMQPLTGLDPADAAEVLGQDIARLRRLSTQLTDLARAWDRISRTATAQSQALQASLPDHRAG